MIFRCPLTMPPWRTMPSISEMTAVSRGFRASKSSTTRGRPPVMSFVFVVSRGIFARTWPANTVSSSSTIKCACDGMWYLRSTLPLLSRISIIGCFFSSGESTTICRERPVTSSTSSWTVTSDDDVLVLHAARILGEDRERVRIPLDEHLTLLDVLTVAHLEARAVDDRVPLAIASLGVLDDDGARAVHDDELALFWTSLGAWPTAPPFVSTTCRPS